MEGRDNSKAKGIPAWVSCLLAFVGVGVSDGEL